MSNTNETLNPTQGKLLHWVFGIFTALLNVSLVVPEVAVNENHFFTPLIILAGLAMGLLVMALPTLRANYFNEARRGWSIVFTAVFCVMRIAYIYSLKLRAHIMADQMWLMFLGAGILLLSEIMFGWVLENTNPLQPTVDELNEDVSRIRDDRETWRKEALAGRKTIKGLESENDAMTTKVEKFDAQSKQLADVSLKHIRLKDVFQLFVVSKATIRSGVKYKACLCGGYIKGSGSSKRMVHDGEAGCHSEWNEETQSWVKVGRSNLPFLPQLPTPSPTVEQATPQVFNINHVTN